MISLLFARANVITVVKMNRSFHSVFGVETRSRGLHRVKCKKERTQCSVLVGTFETTFAGLAVDVLVVPVNGKTAVKLTQFRRACN